MARPSPLSPVPLLLVGALGFFCSVAQGETVEIGIVGYKFVPAETQLRVGDTVRWVNQEKRTSHSVLFPAEDNLESERLMPGDTWEKTFATPGTVDYHCGPHPEMQGRLIVQ